jgi:hypothetical protein
VVAIRNVQKNFKTGVIEEDQIAHRAIKEIVQLITDAVPGIDKDLECILELIYKYANEARAEGYEQGRKHYES